jgi:hypothetical protein
MGLWMNWWNVVRLLRPGFSRSGTFFWFVAAVMGFTVRTELLGVTSLVRALKLHPRYYNNLVNQFHSSAVKLDLLCALWTQIALRIFPQPLQVNGRRVVVGDGIKIPKCGRKMPGVKLLHQQSANNTKPEYIMGHSLQAVSLLVHAANSFFAVPLAARIHEGLVWSNRDRRTLLDKMLTLLGIIDLGQPLYFVADAYYASRKIVKGLLEHDNHLITRCKSNAVAYTMHRATGIKKRGRPKFYDERVKLKTVFDSNTMQRVQSPVYGERDVAIEYRSIDLLWRPTGRLVRFVAVIHPSRGRCLLMCTDLSLEPLEIIRIYGLRFKIEYSFKQAVRVIGSFSYHFWMKEMKPLRSRQGDQYLHRESPEYRAAIARKIHAYHVFVQAGLICQGLLQYLAVIAPSQVWNSFGSWLRTIRPGIPPSELVVANALRQTLPDFLLNNAETDILAKFITEHQDHATMEMFRMAS